MAPLFFFLVIAALVTFAIRSHAKKSRERLERWRIAGRELDLALEEQQIGVPLGLSGRLGDIWVRAEYVPGSKNSAERVVYSANAGHQLPFELKPGAGETLFGLIGGRDIEIGDNDLDWKFRIDGREAAVRASLSKHVRAELLSMNHVSLVEGTLKMAVDGDPEPSEVALCVRRLLALVGEMRVDTANVGEKLYRTIAREDEVLPKRRQLAALFETVTDPKIWEPAIDVALASPTRRRGCSARSRRANAAPTRSASSRSISPCPMSFARVRSRGCRQGRSVFAI